MKTKEQLVQDLLTIRARCVALKRDTDIHETNFSLVQSSKEAYNWIMTTVEELTKDLQ